MESAAAGGLAIPAVPIDMRGLEFILAKRPTDNEGPTEIALFFNDLARFLYCFLVEKTAADAEDQK